MASPSLRRRVSHHLLALSLLGGGLWMAGTALWQLGKTAVYVHESVVVTGTVIDVRQKPFESWADTLGKGNLSWPGDVSYQPIVRFTLPGGIDAIRLDLAADNVDYRTGEEISIISPPDKPGKAHINRWKFLWGASCLRLGTGSILALIGHVLLRRLRGKRSAPAKQEKPAQRENRAPSGATKAPRKRKAARENSGSSKPRRKKKTESAAADESAAPKKPRRNRRKKADAQLESGL